VETIPWHADAEKGGEVIQQGDAGRGIHPEASFDEAPYESDFQSRRKLPLHSSDCPASTHRGCRTFPQFV
jgi:hypothetical protein